MYGSRLHRLRSTPCVGHGRRYWRPERSRSPAERSRVGAIRAPSTSATRRLGPAEPRVPTPPMWATAAAAPVAAATADRSRWAPPMRGWAGGDPTSDAGQAGHPGAGGPRAAALVSAPFLAPDAGGPPPQAPPPKGPPSWGTIARLCRG